MFNFQHKCVKHTFSNIQILYIPLESLRVEKARGMFIHKKNKTINQLDNGRLEIWCVFHLSLELTRDSWRNTFKMVQPPRMNMYVLDSNHMVNTDSCFSFSTHYDNESPLVFLFNFLSTWVFEYFIFIFFC